MPQRTRAQNYSKNIYEQFLVIKERPNIDENRYGTLCHQFPVMVLQNGLMQGVGYLKGKGEGENQSPEILLLTQIASLFNYTDTESFHTELHNCDISKYQYYTRQVLEMAIWYKRYAESMLEVKSGGGDS